MVHSFVLRLFLFFSVWLQAEGAATPDTETAAWSARVQLLDGAERAVTRELRQEEPRQYRPGGLRLDAGDEAGTQHRDSDAGPAEQHPGVCW